MHDLVLGFKIQELPLDLNKASTSVDKCPELLLLERVADNDGTDSGALSGYNTFKSA